MSAQSAEVIALFRYRIIGEATSARLGPAERGRIVRELARRVYEHRMAASVSTPAARSTVGSAPIASKV